MLWEAHSILTDPDKKTLYDLQKKTIESKNFTKQKTEFDKYIKLQESNNTQESTDTAKANFKLEYQKMDLNLGLILNAGPQ